VQSRLADVVARRAAELTATRSSGLRSIADGQALPIRRAIMIPLKMLITTNTTSAPSITPDSANTKAARKIPTGTPTHTARYTGPPRHTHPGTRSMARLLRQFVAAPERLAHGCDVVVKAAFRATWARADDASSRQRLLQPGQAEGEDARPRRRGLSFPEEVSQLDNCRPQHRLHLRPLIRREVHSNVRRLVFGPEEDFEHYLGCKVAACVVDSYGPRDDLIYVTCSTPGRQLARFALRGDRTMFLFIFRAEHDSTGVAPKDQLCNQFGDVGWECRDILAALDDVDDLYFDVVSQIRMDRWSRDRVLLIGDAAACISLLDGEGTGLAITEAYVLAGELARAAADYRRAFDAYEARLRPFIKTKQAGAGAVHLVLRHADPIRPVVPQRGDAHDEFRPAGQPVRQKRARRLRAARIRHIAGLQPYLGIETLDGVVS
jgi:FAD binding domain